MHCILTSHVRPVQAAGLVVEDEAVFTVQAKCALPDVLVDAKGLPAPWVRSVNAVQSECLGMRSAAVSNRVNDAIVDDVRQNPAGGRHSVSAGGGAAAETSGHCVRTLGGPADPPS